MNKNGEKVPIEGPPAHRERHGGVKVRGRRVGVLHQGPCGYNGGVR